MKSFFFIFVLIAAACVGFSGCYSFTGASIAGKTINVRPFENRALNVVPTAAISLNNRIRTRIISQTGLAPVNTDDADYDIQGAITGYNVTIAGAANATSNASNRLTISLEVDFKNRKDDKQSFRQTFSRFADFKANEQLQGVENQLIEDIGAQLAEDIFNKAFVNW